jgi:hypothetical protein
MNGMSSMKALSVKQPWAGLIASGKKTVELRSWRTKYRGPLLICASARPSRTPLAQERTRLLSDAPTGVALCVVQLVDIVPAARRHAQSSMVPAPEGWAWILERPELVDTFPVRGSLGVFEHSFR